MKDKETRALAKANRNLIGGLTAGVTRLNRKYDSLHDETVELKGENIMLKNRLDAIAVELAKKSNKKAKK